MAQHDFDPYEPLDALRAGEDVDLIRSSVELVLQRLIGARPSESSSARIVVGFDARIRPTESICCSPPEHSPACAFKRFSSFGK